MYIKLFHVINDSQLVDVRQFSQSKQCNATMLLHKDEKYGQTSHAYVPSWILVETHRSKYNSSGNSKQAKGSEMKALQLSIDSTPKKGCSVTQRGAEDG